jgi:eukaryotic-like serine/threonine-protein kinase
MWTSDAAVTDETRPAPREIPPGDSGSGLLAMALQAEHRPSVIVPGAPDVTGYEIIRKLGAGSSGEVWLAEEEETGRIVALKILHRHGSTAASVEMLRREIRTLATLVHPNLVLLFGAVATTDGRQGLATEWIDGWPLDEWLELHPDISLDEKLKLFHGMVAGVAYLHDHGVIHRDLKPANLIVDAEGKVKIVDFGLARLHQEGAATGMDGGSVGVSGTLHFMAPEQAANTDGARTMPVDVYALGLILFRILTGKMAVFAGEYSIGNPGCGAPSAATGSLGAGQKTSARSAIDPAQDPRPGTRHALPPRTRP